MNRFMEYKKFVVLMFDLEKSLYSQMLQGMSEEFGFDV